MASQELKIIESDIDTKNKEIIIDLIKNNFKKYQDNPKEISKELVKELLNKCHISFNCFILDKNSTKFYYEKIPGYNFIAEYNSKKIILFSKVTITETNTSSNKKLNLKEVIEDVDVPYFTPVEILDCDMETKLKQDVFLIISKCGQNNAEDDPAFISECQKELESIYGGLWNILIILNKNFAYQINYQKGYKLILRVQQKYFMVFKAITNSQSSANTSPIPKVIDTKMDEELKNFCLFTTLSIVETTQNKITVAEKIVDVIEKTHGKYWQCLVLDVSGNGGMKINYKIPNYINFVYKNYQYIIFQSP